MGGCVFGCGYRDSLLHLDALHDVDGLLDDGIRVLGCHILNVHAPLRAANQHWALRGRGGAKHEHTLKRYALIRFEGEH